MNIFGSGKGPDPEKLARDEASRESIARGGLPLNAIDRLTEEAQRNRDGKPFFTSDLSPNELLLTRQCGFEPLGQVMGSTIYHVGLVSNSAMGWAWFTGEITVLSEARTHARQLAFSRLQQEAKLLGADGVVGVRFTRQESNVGPSMIEFMAVGTAVRRIPDGTIAPPVFEPFVSNLSGQDHWALRQAGSAPLGFVFGTCAWFQLMDWRGQSAMTSWRNMEITSATQGLYTAREIAMERLMHETRLLHAEGVVGVDFENHIQVIEAGENQTGGFILQCTAYGTAIGTDPVPFRKSHQIANFISLRD